MCIRALARCTARASPVETNSDAVASMARHAPPPDGGVANLSNALHVHDDNCQSSKNPHRNEARLHLIRPALNAECVIDADHHGVQYDHQDDHRHQRLAAFWRPECHCILTWWRLVETD